MQQAIRIIRRNLARKGERKTWTGKAPDVELDRYAVPGLYPLAYVEDDAGYVCPDCAQQRLEDDGEFPDGFQALEGTAEDYGGAVYCGACGCDILQN